MIISVEGNIGTGKSTFLRIIRDKYKDSNIIFLDEPLNKWLELKDTDGENILEKFYKNQERWSYSFQMNAFITRIQQLEEALDSTNLPIICERTVETDRYCFAQHLYESDKIGELEWKLYNHWFDFFSHMTKIDSVIYLKTNPDICFDRIQQRNRKGEDKIFKEGRKSLSGRMFGD